MGYYTFLMVLNDGETYTDLEGCRIVRIRAKLLTELEEKGTLELLLKDLPTIRIFEDEPKVWDNNQPEDMHERLLRIKRRILEHDGWAAKDLETINRLIARERGD